MKWLLLAAAVLILAEGISIAVLYNEVRGTKQELNDLRSVIKRELSTLGSEVTRMGRQIEITSVLSPLAPTLAERVVKLEKEVGVKPPSRSLLPLPATPQTMLERVEAIEEKLHIVPLVRVR